MRNFESLGKQFFRMSFTALYGLGIVVFVLWLAIWNSQLDLYGIQPQSTCLSNWGAANHLYWLLFECGEVLNWGTWVFYIGSGVLILFALVHKSVNLSSAVFLSAVLVMTPRFVLWLIEIFTIAGRFLMSGDLTPFPLYKQGWAGKTINLYSSLFSDLAVPGPCEQDAALINICDVTISQGFLIDMQQLISYLYVPAACLGFILVAILTLTSVEGFYRKRFKAQEGYMHSILREPEVLALMDGKRNLEIKYTTGASPFIFSTFSFRNEKRHIVPRSQIKHHLILPIGLGQLVSQATSSASGEARYKNLLSFLLQHEQAHVMHLDTLISSSLIPFFQSLKAYSKTIMAGLAMIFLLFVAEYVIFGHVFMIDLGQWAKTGIDQKSFLNSPLPVFIFIGQVLSAINGRWLYLFPLLPIMYLAALPLVFSFLRRREYRADSAALDYLIKTNSPSEIDTLFQDLHSYLHLANFWCQENRPSTGSRIRHVIIQFNKRLRKVASNHSWLSWNNRCANLFDSLLSISSPHPGADARIKHLREEMRDHKLGWKERFANWCGVAPVSWTP